MSSTGRTADLPNFKPDIHDLDSKKMEQLNRRMQPGACSQVGFLGKGKSLRSVCQKDARYLKERGITFKQISDKLDAIFAKERCLRRSPEAQIGRLGEYHVIIDGQLRIPPYLCTVGAQECPFSPDPNDMGTWCGLARAQMTIINSSTGEKLENITELTAHMIRDHHFFQGSSPYRADPKQLIDVLGLEPGKSYKHEETRIKVFDFHGSGGSISKEEVLQARKEAKEHYLAEDHSAELFLLPYSGTSWENYPYRGLTHRQRIQKLGEEAHKSQAEIDKDIGCFIKEENRFFAIFSESRIDKQVWKDRGKQYLHAFVYEEPSKALGNIKIAGVSVDLDKLSLGRREFILREERIPTLGDSDRIELVQSPKRQKIRK